MFKLNLKKKKTTEFKLVGVLISFTQFNILKNLTESNIFRILFDALFD